jgi:hypothetical protein
LNLTERQVIVSYDALRIKTPQLQDIIEKSGFSASVV